MEAPDFLRSLAARVMVLEVSARSSMRMAVRFATLPTRSREAFWRSWVWVGRRS